jgi:hypothetical protein
METMFFRQIPEWELILKTIESFEKEFNSIDGVSKEPQLTPWVGIDYTNN